MWLLNQVKSVAIKLVASFTRMTIVITYRSSNVNEVEFGISSFAYVVPEVFLLVPRGTLLSYGVSRDSSGFFCPAVFLMVPCYPTVFFGVPRCSKVHFDVPRGAFGFLVVLRFYSVFLFVPRCSTPFLAFRIYPTVF